MSFAFCAFALLLPTGEPTAAAPPQTPAPAVLDHGDLTWFEGSFEELLAEARRSNRVVFLDFWAEWCGYCRKLDRVTFENDAVVAEMADLLCFAIDVESSEGTAIKGRYAVETLPTLVFLDPDGSRRDVLVGFHSAEPFLAEVRRIERNEGTVGGWRERIAREPANLLPRYELAVKLRAMGDRAGHDELIAEIHALDPEGRSEAMRRIRVDRSKAELAELRNALHRNDYDLADVRAFIARNEEPEVLFRAWRIVWKVEGYQARIVEDPRPADEHRKRCREAGRKAWSYVPDELVARFGNDLAWKLWEGRESLDRGDKAFALQVARRAAAAEPENVYVLDTLACCLSMNDRGGEAIEKVRLCMELDPKNPQWQKRLEELSGPRPATLRR